MPHPAWAHNSLAQVSIQGQVHGQQVVNVFAFEASALEEALLTTDALAQIWATSIATEWVAQLQAAWLNCLPNTYVINAVRAQVVERPALYEHRLGATEVAPGAPANGQNGTDGMGMDVAGVIRWKSTLAGRSHRGRTYVGPCPILTVVGGTIQGGLITNLQAVATAMLARFKIGTGAFDSAHFTVYSRPYDDSYYTKRVGGVPTVVHQINYGGNSTAVLTSAVDANARTQRRRNLGVGR